LLVFDSSFEFPLAEIKLEVDQLDLLAPCVQMQRQKRPIPRSGDQTVHVLLVQDSGG